MNNFNKILIVTLLTFLVLQACEKDKEIQIISIEVKTLPDKVNFVVGDTIDYSGLVVSLNKDDGSKEDVEFADFDKKQIILTSEDPVNTALEIKVTHLESNVYTYFTIHIVDKAIAKLEVKNVPDKTEYIEGEKLDLTGLVITATYNNNDTEDIDLTNFETKNIGISVKQDTVLNAEMSYIEIKDNFTQVKTNIDITVNAVMGIALIKAPQKLEYYFGEILDLSNLEVALVLDNSASSSTIPLDNFEDFSISTFPNDNYEIDSVFTELKIVHTLSGKSLTIAPYIVHKFLSDIDGNNYKIIRIKDNVWMAENLKVTRYSDGSVIPLVEQDASWKGAWDDPFKGYCYYNNNASGEKEVYGALYSYNAAVNATPYSGEDIQGVCPSGWHIPSSVEWQSIGGGIMDGAIKLKESGNHHWGDSNNGTNYYGFTALPAGRREAAGFFELGQAVYFWSSNEISNNYASGYSMTNTSDYFYSGSYFKNSGYSVRCVKDVD